jgi:hypothetical protein
MMISVLYLFLFSPSQCFSSNFLDTTAELNLPKRGCQTATRGHAMMLYLGFELMLAATVVIGTFAAFWIART